ncbi:MAG: lipocalin family protein [Myxococcales bacterium]
MKHPWLALATCLAFALPDVAGAVTPPLHPMRERFEGTWYEIARFPERIGADCHNTKVTFELQADGSFDAISSCRKGSPDGPEKKFRARAWLLGPPDKPQVRVVYKVIFRLQVPVLRIGDQFDYVVVGSRDGKHLSIASRSKHMSEAQWQELMERLSESGVNVERLVRVPQT